MIQPTDSFAQKAPTLEAVLVKTLPTKSGGESSLYIYQDSLFLGCSNLKVKIFQMKQSKEVQTMTAYSSKVKCMYVNENYLFSGQEGEQGIIKVWDTATYNLIRVLKGHSDTIQMITGLSKDQVFSASSDGSVRGWDISKADEVVYKLQHQYPVLVVQCINKQLLVSGGDGCLLIVWQWAKQIKLKTFFSHACSLTCLLLKDNELISAGGDGIVRFWNIEQLTDHASSPQFSDDKKKAQIKISQNTLKNCCIFKNQIIMVDDDNRIFLVNENSYQQIKIDIPYYQMITGVESYNNQIIVITNTSDARVFEVQPINRENATL